MKTGSGRDHARVLAQFARYLGHGVRSTAAARAYLERRGVPPEMIEPLLGESRQRGWLDDRAAVKLWADHWDRQGYAWAVIESRLRDKGFDDRAVAVAAATYGTASSEAARARRVAASMWRRASSSASLARRLAARGFAPELTGRLVDELTGGSPSEW